MVARSAPLTLMPTGVRMPVESMSRRPLIGMVQALEMPGSWSAAFISFSSSSWVIRSRQNGRSSPFSQPGRPGRVPARLLAPLRLGLEDDGGLHHRERAPGRWRCWRGRPCRRPARPRGRSRRILSWIWSAFCASADGHAGLHRRRHVEDRPLPQRRHELRAEREVDRDGGEHHRDARRRWSPSGAGARAGTAARRSGGGAARSGGAPRSGTCRRGRRSRATRASAGGRRSRRPARTSSASRGRG